MCSTSPGRGPYASRFSACWIASSGVSSVIGRFLSEGSCFSFLLLALADSAEGRSIPNVKRKIAAIANAVADRSGRRPLASGLRSLVSDLVGLCTGSPLLALHPQRRIHPPQTNPIRGHKLRLSWGGCGSCDGGGTPQFTETSAFSRASPIPTCSMCPPRQGEATLK